MSPGPASHAALCDELVARPARSLLDPRTRRLLQAPIAVTLLCLAAPNMLVMIVQASLGLIETYFISWLGTEALAGIALVFPAVMLMQMMSAGAVGGGISSAVARSLGAGRPEDADRLAIHALAISIGFALAFSAGGFCSAGRSIGRWVATAPRSTRRLFIPTSSSPAWC